MLYLEDYLEMIEHLPQELRDRFTEMREMDLQVHNSMDSLEEQTKQFFSNAKLMRTEQRDLEYDRIKQDYYKTIEDAEEKVHLANQVYDLVDKYLRRLDQELQKFKIELEADNSGITEVLERRSLELDNPPQPVVNHVREKRKYTFHSTGNNASPHNTSFSSHHLDRSHMTSSDKVLSTIAQEMYRESVANPNALSSGPGVITSSNITSNRLNANAFTPLLAVVNQSSQSNGSNSGVMPSNPSFSGVEKANQPQGAFRCNAIAAAASQAIAATQQMQMGRRTASLKASYEAAISSGFSSIFNPLRDNDFPHTPDLMNRSVNSLGYGYDRSGRATKRSRTSHYGADGSTNSHISINNSSLFDDNSSDTLDTTNRTALEYYPEPDPNEPRYCVCNQISYGEMVACDNEDCEKEWFHYECVSITQPPKGKWFCPDCSDKLIRKKGRKERT